MNPALEQTKRITDYHHNAGQKVLVVGQALAGAASMSVPKPTYMSCINMFNPNSLITLLQRHKVVSTIKVLGDFPIDVNRCRFVEDSIAGGADYLFFMDMDQTFPADTLDRLFEIISDDRPVVSGMYYLKMEPYSPVLGRYVDWDDELKKHKDAFDKLGFVHSDGRQLVMWRSFTYFEKTYPFQADVIGLGCVLMKTSIFKNLEKPYFRYTRDPRPEHPFATMDEVMPFCAQLKKQNIPIWVDPRVQCGHLINIESNNALFENYRNSSFELMAGKDPEKFEKMSKLFVDVREEQKHGRILAKITNPNGKS